MMLSHSTFGAGNGSRLRENIVQIDATSSIIPLLPIDQCSILVGQLI